MTFCAPPEVIDLVLDLIDHGDLFSTSLVCKQWRDRSQYLLYRALNVPRTWVAWDRVPPDRQLQRMDSLVSHFRQYPRIATFVDQIRFTFYGFHSDSDDLKSASRMIPQILVQLPNIQRLKLSRAYDPVVCDAGPCDTSRLAAVTELELHDSTFMTLACLCELLSMFPRLRKLTLTFPHLIAVETPGARATLPMEHLEDLEFLGINLVPVAPNLRTLRTDFISTRQPGDTHSRLEHLVQTSHHLYFLYLDLFNSGMSKHLSITMDLTLLPRLQNYARLHPRTPRVPFPSCLGALLVIRS